MDYDNTFSSIFSYIDQLLKGMRTLNWKTNLGLVNLDIELKDRTLSLSVSPIHATIILHFQDKGKVSVESSQNLEGLKSNCFNLTLIVG